MKEGKPFFFRIDLIELMDFATEPAGLSMSLLQFSKELKKGQSEHHAIQKIIDEAHKYIEKKKNAGRKGGKAKASSATPVLEDAKAKASTPLARSSNRNSSSTETEPKAETEPKESTPLAPSRKNGSAHKVDFDYSTGRFINISAIMIDLWQQGFPAVNVEQEIIKAGAWAMANPKNRKSNWPKFLTNWLSRSQDSAGRVRMGSGNIASPAAAGALERAAELRRKREEREAQGQ